MSKFSSTVQVLTVETTQSKKLNPDTGKPYEQVAARCILLADNGTDVITVGRLRVPPVLRDAVKVGTFRADFTLQVPDYGDNKGDIVAMLTGLVPIIKAPPAPSAAKPGLAA